MLDSRKEFGHTDLVRASEAARGALSPHAE